MDPVRRGIGHKQRIAWGQQMLFARRGIVRMPVEHVLARAVIGLAPRQIEVGRAGGISGKDLVAGNLEQDVVFGIEVERGMGAGRGS